MFSWSRPVFKRPQLPFFAMYLPTMLPTALRTILLSTTHISTMLLLRKTLHDLIITSSIHPVLLSVHAIHSQRPKTVFFLGLREVRQKCVFNVEYNYHTQIWVVYFRMLFVIHTTQAKRPCDDYSVLNWKGLGKRWSRPRRCHLDIRLQGLCRTMKKCQDR